MFRTSLQCCTTSRHRVYCVAKACEKKMCQAAITFPEMSARPWTFSPTSMFSLPPAVPAAVAPLVEKHQVPICDIGPLARSPSSTSTVSASPAAASVVSAMPSPAGEPGGSVNEMVAAMRAKLGGGAASEPVRDASGHGEQQDEEVAVASEEKPVRKRPAAAAPATPAMKRPAAAPSKLAMKRPAAAADFGLLLGCGKCRRSATGCAQCRDPNFGGRRGP